MQPEKKSFRYHDEWTLEGSLHREDGPAVEYKDGTKKWCINGKLHRLDGPAFEWLSGINFCYIYDFSIVTQEYKQALAAMNHLRNKHHAA
jgi:hypothetical protein